MSIIRRTAAGLLVTLAVLAGSLAWWGFTAQRTILDPQRTAATATGLLEAPAVRSAVAGRLADALAQAFPPEVALSPDDVRAAAEAALADPRFVAAYGEALAAVHAQALAGEPGEPVTIDVTAAGAAAREALLAAQPELARVVPPVTPVSVTLPAVSVPGLASVNQKAPATTGTAALAAVGLLGAGLALSPRRGRVLARVGRNATWLGAGTIAFGLVLPAIADRFGTGAGPLVAALGRNLTAGLVAPAAGLVSVGVATWLTGRNSGRITEALRYPRSRHGQVLGLPSDAG